MEKVKDYLHGCEILGLDPDAKPDNSKIRERDRAGFDALFELTIIIEAQNKLDNFEPNFLDEDQDKFNPWHWVEEDESKVSGVGLSSYDYVRTVTVTIVGSRLVLGSIESAKYIGTEHIAKYEAWYLIPKI